MSCGWVFRDNAVQKDLIPVSQLPSHLLYALTCFAFVLSTVLQLCKLGFLHPMALDVLMMLSSQHLVPSLLLKLHLDYMAQPLSL